MIAGQAELAKIVNRLYWGSSESVNQIAESLDLSKGALYGLIEPAPAEGACPDCASRLSFTNRTARDRGLAECVRCATQPGPGGETPLPARNADLRIPQIPPPRRRLNGRVLAGSLLLGAVAGLLIVRYIRRR